MLNPFKLLKTFSTYIQSENAKYIGKYYIYDPYGEGYLTFFKVVSNISDSPDKVTVLGFKYNGGYSNKTDEQFHKISCEGKLDTFPFEVKNFCKCKEITEEEFKKKLNNHIDSLLQRKPYNHPPY